MSDMLAAIRRGLKKTRNIERTSYILNAISSGFMACQSLIILMFLTRRGGIKEAGIFSIAYSNASFLLYIGLFGIRKYQISDVDRKYPSGSYIGFRIITCACMMVACIIYCIYAYLALGHTVGKITVIFFVCLTSAVQALSDVYEGELQQRGRLDISVKGALLRTTAVVTAYLVVITVSGDLQAASICAFFAAFITFMLTIYNISREFCDRKPTFGLKNMTGLLITGIPLFLAVFLNSYIANAPKYAIDACLGDKYQAIYGFIFMPAFAIGLVCDFIFIPRIVKYSILWNDGHYKEFRLMFLKQAGVITLATLFALAAAYAAGIPVLSGVFGTDLSAYRKELMITVAGGGMLAFVTYFTTIVTIMRRHHLLLLGYGAATAAVMILSKRIVRIFGLAGAVGMYTVIMTCLALLFAATVVWLMVRAERGHGRKV